MIKNLIFLRVTVSSVRNSYIRIPKKAAEELIAYIVRVFIFNLKVFLQPLVSWCDKFGVKLISVASPLNPLLIMATLYICLKNS